MAYEFARYGSPHPTLVVNPAPPTPRMTVPIVGVPRGGTTMVAAVVHALGMDLGPTKDLAEHTFEDQGMTNPDIGLLLSYIARRNREREVWGWKDPSAVTKIQSIFFALRNPRMVLVFRDMIATIDSEMRFDVAKNIQPQRTFSDLSQATVNWWVDNMTFIGKTSFPTLMVSYERVLRRPDLFVRDLGAFLGITPTHEQLQEALARINPDGGYLHVDEQCRPVPVVEALPQMIPENPTAPPEPEAPA